MFGRDRRPVFDNVGTRIERWLGDGCKLLVADGKDHPIDASAMKRHNADRHLRFSKFKGDHIPARDHLGIVKAVRGCGIGKIDVLANLCHLLLQLREALVK